MSTARNLLLLAAAAHKRGRHKTSGSLFAAALASDDIDEFLESIDEEGVMKEEASRPVDDWAVHGSDGDAPRTGLRQIMSDCGEGMLQYSLAATEIEDDWDEEVDEAVDADRPAPSEEFSGIPGQRVIPSSLSSSQGGGSGGQGLTLHESVRSPIKIRS